ncbi:hypothetical protein A9507_03345 [Methanobacterium sp. A39]|uniref:Uncharacterized protein n=2 Tax=Methanobacteriaceae TaxID=2159 RepID=A0A2A2H5M8_METBR|nr:hypothetical protein A9507_03345 [Methanobacterium sp. A39]PAV04739.1 hypothetical protein ASJ80_10510 [Methanobacterium bryantii]
MAIFLVILMMGVAPAFAVDSPADQQTVVSTAVKQTNSDIKDVSQVLDSSNTDMVTSFDVSDPEDEDSGYIDGYDDDGNYIGNYTVIDPSDLECIPDDQLDETDDYTVSSFNIPGEDIEYIDELYSNNMADSASMDEFDDEGNDLLEVLDTVDEGTDYLGDVSIPSYENDNFDELNANDQFDEDGYDMFTELNLEFGYDGPHDIDQLNESQDEGVNELDNGNFTVIDSSDVPLSEDTSQISTNVSANCKPLIVTIVNGLCGVVQATLEELGNVCMILGNELETIF